MAAADPSRPGAPAVLVLILDHAALPAAALLTTLAARWRYRWEVRTGRRQPARGF